MKLLKKVRALMNRLLCGKGKHICQMTKAESLEDFFELICPFTTDKKLIRIGGSNDGGYLVPDDFVGISTCFSPGVAESASFELDLATRGIKCFLADYSVDAPPIEHPLFNFRKTFIGPVNCENYITLESWIESSELPQGDLMLQMDIEGSEYQVILSTDQATLGRFRIIVIEFHNLHNLRDEGWFELIKLTFKKLLVQFDLVHIHPNNCEKPKFVAQYLVPPVVEFTFIRKDRIKYREPTLRFPNELDEPNVPHLSDVNLEKFWFNKKR
jgi:hypothetical protein